MSSFLFIFSTALENNIACLFVGVFFAQKVRWQEAGSERWVVRSKKGNKIHKIHIKYKQKYKIISLWN